MRTHVTRTVLRCTAPKRSIRRSVTKSLVQSLVVSLVLTRLDYGSATLTGLPMQILDRLQSVMNAAVGLVCSARKYDHVTPQSAAARPSLVTRPVANHIPSGSLGFS